MGTMNVKLYQIDMERDKNMICFMHYKALPQFQKSQEIDSAIYNKVFDGELETESLEGLYEIFNLHHPEGYHGRSMSVSDVVQISGAKGVPNGCYFCDDFGFKPVQFEPQKTKDMTNTIRVVLCEPDKFARIANIDASLVGMQQVIEGSIEAYYPFEEQVCIVCNEEGKINGMPLNRAVYANGEMVEVMAGPFFICDCSGSKFESLSDEQLIKYRRMFQRPERFVKFNDKLVALPYSPKKDNHER